MNSSINQNQRNHYTKNIQFDSNSPVYFVAVWIKRYEKEFKVLIYALAVCQSSFDFFGCVKIFLVFVWIQRIFHLKYAGTQQ